MAVPLIGGMGLSYAASTFLALSLVALFYGGSSSRDRLVRHIRSNFTGEYIHSLIGRLAFSLIISFELRTKRTRFQLASLLSRRCLCVSAFHWHQLAHLRPQERLLQLSNDPWRWLHSNIPSYFSSSAHLNFHRYISKQTRMPPLRPMPPSEYRHRNWRERHPNPAEAQSIYIFRLIVSVGLGLTDSSTKASALMFQGSHSSGSDADASQCEPDPPDQVDVEKGHV
ncbi:hypothetical protein DFH07DRAFT_848303 [Mycena maculata]|uniref:Uncharacterized protein n=1 Tax=Mycena maculata TaxID=230809 RepID=A0AAD7HYA0_9AGAR|nr:hypothetical protein DFH07DRAFT_848303 [Mycena maculata]